MKLFVWFCSHYLNLILSGLMFVCCIWYLTDKKMKSIQWAIISFAFGLLNLVVGLKNILKIKADNILWNYIQFSLVNLIVLGFIVWGVITIVKIIKNKYK